MMKKKSQKKLRPSISLFFISLVKNFSTLSLFSSPFSLLKFSVLPLPRSKLFAAQALCPALSATK